MRRAWLTSNVYDNAPATGGACRPRISHRIAEQKVEKSTKLFQSLDNCTAGPQ